jgi:hypothetical protein
VPLGQAADPLGALEALIRQAGSLVALARGQVAALDPEVVAAQLAEAVREAVMCVFRRFDQLGSARQVVVSLRADGLRLPRRDIRTGKIMWAQAGYPAVHDILIHPGYAGVFAYGRSKTEKHLAAGGNVITRQRRLPRDQWAVMIPGHHTEEVVSLLGATVR